MTIGIFDPYLDTLSGGEKYMLRAALCLSKTHTVSLLWNTDSENQIRKKVSEKFGFSMDEISFSENIFAKDVNLVERYRKSLQYDAVLFLSDGSIPLVGCKLYVHFQSPMGWVNPRTLKDRLKIRKVRKFITNSQFTKLYIDKTFKVKSTVLYPPIDDPLEHETKKENIILNVGRFGINHPGSSYKKQEILMDAFQKMRLKNWKLVLVMSTAEGQEDSIKTLKEQIGQDAITCIINPDSKLLHSYYAKAKVYWHAAGFAENLDQHPDRAEHFGMATVEAMSYGAVPIVINKGGQKEIVTPAEDGYVWNSIDELIHQTNDIVTNLPLFDQFSAAAREKAKQFSIHRFCKEISEIIT